MTELNPSHDATYSDAVLELEKPIITDPAMRLFVKLERERTIAKLRDLDRLLGRKQTIPRRVR
jgi:hypothetical protein